MGLQHAIYGWHLRRKQESEGPYPYDPMEDELAHCSDEERDRLTGFADPQNTVAVMAPIVDAYGVQYGSRVEMISPKLAGDRIDADRETILHLRESLAEQRFWRRFLARAAWVFVALNALTLLFLIGG